MKLKAYLLLAAALALLCCCCTAAGEEPAACSIRTGEQWSWSRGAYNTFSGTIDLTGFSGGKSRLDQTFAVIIKSIMREESINEKLNNGYHFLYRKIIYAPSTPASLPNLPRKIR